ncbi:MAG: carboxypeptidase regulatory-like domain-containing protein [Acidobacteriia bacterium]|nr:carboxypeptidase regulatory-like domain-containing protein [Terriglobia bacterium]
MQKFFRVLLFSLGLCLLPVFAYAQGQLGVLTGSVLDPSGAVIPGASIVITETNTGVVTNINASSAGYYRVPVPPGTYKLEASQQGFKTAVVENIVVPVAQVVTIDLNMQMGRTAESILVTATAPLLTPSTAEVGNAVSPQEFATLPVAMSDGARQLMTFIYTSLPGTAGDDWSGTINGGQYFTTDILIDGLPVARYDLQGSISEVTPSADAASEFRVEMSGYSAEFGNTGGGVANFGMKSGTNDFHGTLYEYNTNPIFNATGYDVNKLPEGTPWKIKRPLRENNFGGAIGGPIVKNKTFFFFAYEGDRYRSLSPRSYGTVPTLAMRDRADFSQRLGGQIGTDALGRAVFSNEIYDPTSTRRVTAGAVDPVTGVTALSSAVIRDGFGFDPVTGEPLAGSANVIPQAYWSQVSAKLLPLFPTPINDHLTNNIPTYGGQPLLNSTKISTKIDQVINDKHKLSGFFTYSFRHRMMARSGYYLPIPGIPLNQTKVQEIPARLFRLSEDWTISGTTLNHFGFGYNRFGNLNGQPAGDPSGYLPSQLGITGVLDSGGLPFFKFSSKGNIMRNWGRYGSPEWRAEESFVVADTLSHVRGKHSFKFGAELIRYRMNDNFTGQTSGEFDFNEVDTGLPGSMRKTTGLPFASFIIGAVDSGSRAVNLTTPGWRQNLWTLYAQDDWRISPKLTLNYGLRWYIPTALTEVYNRMSSLDPTVPNPGADFIPGAMVFVGNCPTCTHTRAFQRTYFGEFGPRLGFAYNPTQKLVIRGGYGISYSPPIMNGFPGADQGFNSSVPFGNTSLYPRPFNNNAAVPALFLSALQGAPLPAGVQVGVPAFIGTLPNFASDGQNYNGVGMWTHSMAQPYVQNWNLGFQYMLPGEILFEADYVGTKGTHLMAKDLGRYYNSAPAKFKALGDTLDLAWDDAMADPVASAQLAALGVTQKPFPSFDGGNTISQAILRYPQFGQIVNNFPNFGNSTYHALQATVRKRGGHGLNFIASYTWSKTLTNTDGALYGYSGYYYNGQDYYNPKADKSIASFDYRHFLKLTWIYDLPFGNGKRWLGSAGKWNHLVGGWKITAIQQYRSGHPLTVYDTNLSSGIGAGETRLDLLSGVNPLVKFQGPLDPDNGTPFLNPAAFADPPLSDSGTYALRPGTAPRMLNIRGPGNQNEDFGILKDINFSERYKLVFRADFFNVFNRTGLGDPTTDYSTYVPDDPVASQFGKIFDVAHGPRNIMLSLRFDF